MTVSGATLLKPSASNHTPELLSVALFVSGSLDFILSGFNSLTSTLAAIAEIVSGVIPLVYAMFRREEHVAGARQLHHLPHPENDDPIARSTVEGER